MCSVSWLLNPEGYQVFFNRDEQKTRASALVPKQMKIDGVNVLIPIDPVGLGSWISTNQFGLSLCLLNNYQAVSSRNITTRDPLLSRGLLLKYLATCHSSRDVIEHFLSLNLDQFSPFTLLAFDPELSTKSKEVIALRWNGESHDISITDSPLFSSSVDFEEVTRYRQQIYYALTKEVKNTSTLLAFHSHHHPTHQHMSPCMHREDAHTVSFTHLNISPTHQEMSYIAGPPCCRLTEKRLSKNSTHIQISETLIS